MKKVTAILSALFAVFIVFGMMEKASASELDQELKEDLPSNFFTETSIIDEHEHEYEHEHDTFAHDSVIKSEQITPFVVCNHVGTLKQTKYIGIHSKCGGPLYYVYCKPCGKFTGKTICLCP
ncbi:hypothetical protein I6G82_09460 [Lysinibacillus macroides]|uniref:Uncharacterized protein n=1 Tax=Lysinibacillus macroides TaxID=33935 RepID=A0A0N0CUY0_9BACI|nr:hypothetical protein [Lysinibacillus macroides]KOY80644.1 hypothetical protein ADM90_15705 [Lysinibacillus macroides]QPR69780.1 hypothetical protein I6G82_09460 [Lysinibacillus macroides]